MPYSQNFKLKRFLNGGWPAEQNVRMAIHFSSPRQKLKHYIHIRVTMILDFLKRKYLNRFTGSIFIVYFFLSHYNFSRKSGLFLSLSDFFWKTKMDSEFLKIWQWYECTLFRNESITDINYPELLSAFYHYIILDFKPFGLEF